jgi:hypothetical protein
VAEALSFMSPTELNRVLSSAEIPLLPAWTTAPDFERVMWLNKAIDQL